MSHTSRHNKHSDAFWHDRSQNKPEFVPRKGLDEYADAHSSDTSSQGKRHDAIAGGNGTRTTPKNRPALDLAAYRHPDLLAKARTSQNGGAAFARLHTIADRIEREMSPEEIQCELSKYQTQKKKVKSVGKPSSPLQPPAIVLEKCAREYELFCSTGQITQLEIASGKLTEWVGLLQPGGHKMRQSRCKAACWLMEIGNAYRHCQYGVVAKDIEKAKQFYKKAAALGSTEAMLALNSMKGA